MQNISYELKHYNRGVNHIAGIDEVGRGPLAGPMVTAAVVFKRSDIEALLESPQKMPKEFLEITDSKKISEKKRERLSEFIKEHAQSYSIQELSVDLIDTQGISQATQIGFYNAFKNLSYAEFVLTDNFKINAMPLNEQENITKGDILSISIAAASIIAKVYRDNLMKKLAEEYSVYGFDKHKGYGTKVHIEAIKIHGPSVHHRKSFEPIKTIYKSQKS